MSKIQNKDDEEKIIKYIDSISFLAGLFDIEIKVKAMPIQVDIKKTFLIRPKPIQFKSTQGKLSY